MNTNAQDPRTRVSHDPRTNPTRDSADQLRAGARQIIDGASQVAGSIAGNRAVGTAHSQGGTLASQVLARLVQFSHAGLAGASFLLMIAVAMPFKTTAPGKHYSMSSNYLSVPDSDGPFLLTMSIVIMVAVFVAATVMTHHKALAIAISIVSIITGIFAAIDGFANQGVTDAGAVTFLLTLAGLALIGFGVAFLVRTRNRFAKTA